MVVARWAVQQQAGRQRHDGGARNAGGLGAGAAPERMTRLMHRYMDRATDVSIRNLAVNHAMNQVINLPAAPAALFKPTVFLPVLLGLGEPPLTEPPLYLSVTPSPATLSTDHSQGVGVTARA